MSLLVELIPMRFPEQFYQIQGAIDKSGYFGNTVSSFFTQALMDQMDTSAEAVSLVALLFLALSILLFLIPHMKKRWSTSAILILGIALIVSALIGLMLFPKSTWPTKAALLIAFITLLVSICVVFSKKRFKSKMSVIVSTAVLVAGSMVLISYAVLVSVIILATKFLLSTADQPSVSFSQNALLVALLLLLLSTFLYLAVPFRDKRITSLLIIFPATSIILIAVALIGLMMEISPDPALLSPSDMAILSVIFVLLFFIVSLMLLFMSKYKTLSFLNHFFYGHRDGQAKLTAS